ncbi:hypothetical protein ASE33_04085 [Pseudomonas sp. Root9]|uniref:hypothetical protein n=1 Tax=Pseudomonas sp. Root9 TaxID=1736604 RepID=UPI0006FE963F|nr:hypothetical protein [Pseudomonas sp. Root9]KRC97724.1 hypothetical protein ASE33_04085 [Pseudomonas sp. Root9]
MNIEWSKAPEGFPLWLEGTNEEHRKHSGWYRDAGQVFEGAYGGQWRACREGQFFTVHRNPGPSNWTGEGMPPVGIEIEANMPPRGYRESHEWRRVKVVHGALPDSPGEVLVFDVEETRPAWVDEFRPVRTSKQIAEEARIAELNLMVGAIKDYPGGRHGVDHLTQLKIHEEACINLYDAGYRKQVES